MKISQFDLFKAARKVITAVGFQDDDDHVTHSIEMCRLVCRNTPIVTSHKLKLLWMCAIWTAKKSSCLTDFQFYVEITEDTRKQDLQDEEKYWKREIKVNNIWAPSSSTRHTEAVEQVLSPYSFFACCEFFWLLLRVDKQWNYPCWKLNRSRCSREEAVYVSNPSSSGQVYLKKPWRLVTYDVYIIQEVSFFISWHWA